MIKSERVENNASAADDDNNDYDHIPDNHFHNEHSAGQMNMRGVYLHFLAGAIGSVIVTTSSVVCISF